MSGDNNQPDSKGTHIVADAAAFAAAVRYFVLGFVAIISAIGVAAESVLNGVSQDQYAVLVQGQALDRERIRSFETRVQHCERVSDANSNAIAIHYHEFRQGAGRAQGPHE